MINNVFVEIKLYVMINKCCFDNKFGILFFLVNVFDILLFFFFGIGLFILFLNSIL